MPSSVISDINYDHLTATLRITFVSGLVYDYKNVPGEVYHALKTSGSKGSYLNRNIKNKYVFERIK
jgi:hypothetical protein